MSKEGKKEHAQEMTADGAGRASVPDTRRPEDELPPELKAIEAALASLSPRTDRLDRERVIFLAGQQSVAAGHIRFGKRAGGWAWPAAFAAMTTVAATLLALLLLRPEMQTELRFVEVPVQRPGNDGTAKDTDLPTSPPAEPRPRPTRTPEPLAKPAFGSSLLAFVGLDWRRDHEADPLGSQQSYPRLLDQVLREGVDSLPAPSPVADVQPASAPLPYRELLNRALGTPESDGSVPDRPLIQTLFFPGANS